MRYYFIDRFDAGRQLAERLKSKVLGQDALVLALPRGGVAVGQEMAKILQLPLDVFIARKLGAPLNPELGVGAVAEGGIVVLNQVAISSSGATQVQIQEAIVRETAEVERWLRLYRGNRHNLHIKGKTIILVDDGLATGITVIAAARALKREEPEKLILALPAMSNKGKENVQPEVDVVVCLHEEEDFTSVGLRYQNFEQLTDKDVVVLLEQAHREIHPGPKLV